MTTSEKSGTEFFSTDKNGQKKDAHIHYGILDAPDAGKKTDAGYIERLRDSGALTDDEIKYVEDRMKQQKPQKSTELARGGLPSVNTSFTEHQAYRDLSRSAGMIHSSVPGRTDKLPMRVKGGSYVIPADIVSGIGQGNSLAGSQMLNRMFRMAPGGANLGRISTPKVNYGGLRPLSGGPLRGPAKIPRPPYGFAEGGEKEGTADIIAAGGEYIVPPEIVRRIGGGDIKHGHDILDEMVLHLRKKTIEETKKLKPPKGSGK